MTSRVTSRLRDEVDFADIFKSLFPCGSVTGAPKIRAMEIIDELEDSSRGAYCGGLGYIDPDGDACFNVAIRTLILEQGKLRYNVGSGLVLDSEAADEYAECLLKADVLKAEPVELIETLRWEPELGFVREAKHIERLFRSADKLGYPLSGQYFDSQFQIPEHLKTPKRFRLALSKNGKIDVQISEYTALRSITFSLSKYPLTADVQTTPHKISYRQFYDGERERLKALTGADEAVFLNADGALCEGSFTSLFIEKGGQLFTPPLSAGLLPGILRQDLLETGRAHEKALTPDMLEQADAIYLGNSLRGLIPAEMISPLPC
jgi:para-aminobenzoate synthetase/4-amino-4-deoxychorismate lyase